MKTLSLAFAALLAAVLACSTASAGVAVRVGRVRVGIGRRPAVVRRVRPIRRVRPVLVAPRRVVLPRPIVVVKPIVVAL